MALFGGSKASGPEPTGDEPTEPITDQVLCMHQQQGYSCCDWNHCEDCNRYDPDA